MTTDCCSPSAQTAKHPRKQACPACGGICGDVSYKTVSQHIKKPWKLPAGDGRYYFCDHADCATIYFSDDGWGAGQTDVRTLVGAKEKSPAATLCYCFGVTQGDVQDDPSIKDFVVEQTKQGLCACESRNPSGLCCLKNFPR